jgi:dTDP-4-amino-4,6-dideoxygalactose transaminase
LWVVEDAACGFGARIRGRHAGTFGDAGCFSFHPRKAVTTGEGGMVTTARRDIADAAASLRDHGASRSDFDRHVSADGFLLSEYRSLGFNYRMTDIQGALGCAQMDRAAWVLAERKRRAAVYDERLAPVEWLAPPAARDGFEHGYQAYVCMFQPEKPTLANLGRLHAERNELMSALDARGIATRQGTHAPVLSEYYSSKYGLRADAFPHAVIADRLSLTLPLYPQMTEEDLEAVVHALVQEHG